MNINVISNAYAYSGVQNSVAGLHPPAKQRDEGGRPEGTDARLGHGGGGNDVLGAVFQTLAQAGLNVSAQSTDKSAKIPGPTPASGNGDVKQALHAFMHDVFQSAHATGSSGKAISYASVAENSSAGKRYGELASKLDGLAQQLNSGGGGNALSNLKSSFNNLVKAVNSSSDSGKAPAAGNAPNLQDFLHKLSQNLQGGTLNSVGSLVSTAA